MNSCFILYTFITVVTHNLTSGEDIRTSTNQLYEYNFNIQQITTDWDLAKASGFGLTREEIKQDPLNQLNAGEVCEAAQSYARKNGIAVRMRRTKSYEVHQYGIFRRNTTNPKDVFAGLRCPLVPRVVLRFARPHEQNANSGLVIVIRDSTYLDETYTFNAKTVESVKGVSGDANASEERRKFDRFPLDEDERWEACIAASLRIRPVYEVNLLADDEWSEMPQLYDIDEMKNVLAFPCHSSPKMYLSLVYDENDTNKFAVMVEKQ